METIEINSPKASTCQAESEAEANDCAICLEQLTDKSFTNSCFHMFCFHCLLAWSKVKPECPLCKQDFCSIIHNIRSMDDYDEYRVPPAALRFPAHESTSLFNHSLSHASASYLSHEHDFFARNRRFFSYRTTLLSGGFSIPRERASSLVIQPYVDNLQIQNDCPSVNSSSNSSSRLQRREVYSKELEIRPPVVGSHRVSSPEFYRENEGQMHRLGRWLSRELEAILQLGLRFNPDDVLSLIMEMLPVYEIQSTTFHRALFPNLGIHTRRFIREFYNFAISPYEMEQYDRACVYVRERTGSQLAFIVTVGGDDSEDVQVIPSTSMNQSIRPWVGLTGFDSSRYAPSYLDNRTRNSSLLPSTSLRFATPPTHSSTIHHQVINISDSENDDCVIIDEVRATPETIVLDDSDTENPQLGVVSNVSSTPTPSTSGYRPSTSTTHEDDKSILVLPSTSNLAETKPCCTNPKPEHDSSRSEMDSSLEHETKPINKRSPSIESVMSTDNSIIGSDCSSDPGPSRKKKKKSKQKMSKKPRAKKKSIDFNYCTLSSESSVLESSDSDWEESRRKKKKTKKHSEKCDKKNKKRRKSDRCKSPKRKKSQIDDSDDYREPHKTKRTPAKRKLRSSKETVAEAVTSGSYSSKNSCAEYVKKPSSSSLLNKPKLRSVVKIVEKTNSSRERKVLNCSESEDDGIAGTSFGTMANGDRKLHSLIMRRNTFSSDSD